MMDKAIEEVRQQLKLEADEQKSIATQRFFKEPICSYGVRSTVVNKIAKQVFIHLKRKNKIEIFTLCDELWQSTYLEENSVACIWAYKVHKQYRPDDFVFFKRWVEKFVSNWAICDTLCNHALGTFIELYPKFIEDLKLWCTSKNRWEKRAAAVTLIIPARKGLFLTDIFAIANKLLLDGDDLVQKGYGWMLKAASEAYPQEVFDYLLSKKEIMPRTAFRYALEKMPEAWRKKAMQKAPV